MLMNQPNLSSRSRSLSPRRRYRSPSISPDDSPSHKLVYGSPVNNSPTRMGSFVNSWLVSPTPKLLQQKQLIIPKTPVLTSVLMRMEEMIPRYCKCLAVPTWNNAAKSASLLDDPVSPDNKEISSPSVSHSMKEIQSCWESYITPFLLLSAAEMLYAQERSSRLIDLYLKIANDLTLLQQTLCDPMLRGPGESSLSHSAAVSVRKYVILLRDWTSFRCQMLELITISWLPQQIQHQLQVLWQDLHQLDAGECNDLLESMKREVQIWRWLDDACWSLQQCQFMNTILNLRRIKTSLEYHKKQRIATQLHAWFGVALQQIHNVLPLYFDRICASAKPIYGFDPSLLHSNSTTSLDIDVQIVEFLRKNEGTMAVCIVLEGEDDWPCMYLRSSIEKLTRSHSSATNLSSRLGLGRTMDLESDKNPNQEYTDKFTDNKSWPLSEWNELVTILRNEINPEELGPAMTFRAKEVETESNMNVGFFARPLVNPASYFHVVALSQQLWMVAIVKGEDLESKWNLRMAQRQHSEEECRIFLDKMAMNLKIANLFDNVNRILSVQSKKNQTPERIKKGARMGGLRFSGNSENSSSALSIEKLCCEWNEINTQKWLQSLKDEFGLRPHSPDITPLRSPYQMTFGQHPPSSKRGYRKRRMNTKTTVEESAASWFLGDEILQLAKDGKLIQ
eukprot:CAMPEP_0178908424 /NCGR_PEP_ID=MMETSP0786-20121207/7915_1 /TAXON_ID=186022 /ORGANISM="Thalassionema frauenfeldii, Strain CCMP 1798" /LENGTH=676 /DNA_ID=CAMNT_0020580325 /DNA_START=107 /DNA_END=2137 /DNA_ORIENTATION=+